jgi:hypothetical protein
MPKESTVGWLAEKLPLMTVWIKSQPVPCTETPFVMVMCSV